jgi:OmpA-OmpF porin, OOP family
MRKFLPGLLLLAGSAISPAWAQQAAPPPPAPAADDFTPVTQLPRQFYVSALGSYVLRDSARHTDNGYGGTLALGWQLGAQFDLELSGQYNRLSPASLDGVGLNLLFFPTGQGFYALGGAGWGRVRGEPNLLDYSATLFNFGVGYRYGPFKVLGQDALIRAEALYRIDRHQGAVAADGNPVIDSSYNDAVFNLGVVFPFGPRPHPPAAAAPEPPTRVVPAEAPPPRS